MKDVNLKQKIKQDVVERIEEERKFGLGKRKYGMSLIMAKLPEMILPAVDITILVMNFDIILRSILLLLDIITLKVLLFSKYIIR